MLFLSLESCQKTEQTKGKTLTLSHLEYDVPILWHWVVNKGSVLEGVSRTTAFTDLTVRFSDLLKKLNLFLGESFKGKPFLYYPERLLYSSSRY